MEDTYTITPTLIRRIKAGRGVDLAYVPYEPTGDKALLVFMNEPQAERFREETGAFPASEGFRSQATTLEGLKAIQLVWQFPRVAMRGPEPEAVSYFETEEFFGLLEFAELVGEAGLLDED